MQGIGALIPVALALGTDAFSVAVCVGLSGATTGQKIRLAAGFGTFQFLMPITGLAFGSLLGQIVGEIASCIGGAILVVLGVTMVWRTISVGFHCPPIIHRSIAALVTVSLGVSLDALAVGIGYGLGVGQIPIVHASVIIGVVAFLMTALGVELGGQIGKTLQHYAPVAGGTVLILLGVRIAIGG
ncbi:MAG: manganese efflux pump [Armatimonadetes bacterium]|nr:manganese efflux pump [Armatimonadota bacterium]